MPTARSSLAPGPSGYPRSNAAYTAATTHWPQQHNTTTANTANTIHPTTRHGSVPRLTGGCCWYTTPRIIAGHQVKPV